MKKFFEKSIDSDRNSFVSSIGWGCRTIAERQTRICARGLAMKTIFLNRKSVCMGDDTEDHRIQLHVRDNCSYSEMLKTIPEVRFLPSYDSIWLIQSNKRGFVAAYYNSSYSNDQPNVIWQQSFNENEEISDGDLFCFDCHLFKRELYKYPHEYDKAVETIKNKYNIGDELFQKIAAYLTEIRTR